MLAYGFDQALGAVALLRIGSSRHREGRWRQLRETLAHHQGRCFLEASASDGDAFSGRLDLDDAEPPVERADDFGVAHVRHDLATDTAQQVVREEVAVPLPYCIGIRQREPRDTERAAVACGPAHLAAQRREQELFVRYPEHGIERVQAPPKFPVAPEQGPDLYERLSPLNYLNYVSAAVQIHWGTADETVPYKWPGDLLDGLRAAGKPVDYFEYAGQPHSFQGAGNQLYLRRTADFFAQYLGNGS